MSPQGFSLQEDASAPHLVLPDEALVQDSVEVGEHVSGQRDVVMSHHHHTQ